MKLMLTASVVVLIAGNLCRAQEQNQEYRITESVVSAKAPKRLRTYIPFWGCPLREDGTEEQREILDDCVVCRQKDRPFPDWVCWNLDLASGIGDRYKFSRFVKGNIAAEATVRLAVDECYRWAWRKPYGNTNVVIGPLYGTKDRNCPYAWFVAVCKQERIKGPAPLGFSSIAFIIPASPAPGKSIYDYSRSVNGVEYLSGYNLFPKLPQSVQEQVEEITAYELFCPFQEIDEELFYELEPEFDGGEFNERFDKE